MGLSGEEIFIIQQVNSHVVRGNKEGGEMDVSTVKIFRFQEIEVEIVTIIDFSYKYNFAKHPRSYRNSQTNSYLTGNYVLSSMKGRRDRRDINLNLNILSLTWLMIDR